MCSLEWPGNPTRINPFTGTAALLYANICELQGCSSRHIVSLFIHVSGLSFLHLPDSTKMKVRNQMTERVLDLTVEIIFLLTGEDYIILKRLGEHKLPSSKPLLLEKGCIILGPHSQENERNNEQTILELSNQIIHLLTGEVPSNHEDVTVHSSKKQSDYVDEIHTVNQNIISEDQRPLHGIANCVKEEQLETGIKTKYLDTNDPPYKHVTDKEEEAIVICGKLPESDITNHTEHAQTEYPSTRINEEATSCAEGILTYADVYLPTEHTQTEYTPSAHIKEDPTSSVETNLMDSDICTTTDCMEVDCTISSSMVESDPCEEGSLSHKETHAGTAPTQIEYSSTSVKVESASCGEGNLTGSDICTAIEDTGIEFLPVSIKEELASCEDLSDTYIDTPAVHTQTGLSPHIKEESAMCLVQDLPDTDIHPTTEHIETKYSSINFKRETVSFEGGNLTDTDICSAMEDAVLEYSSIDIKEELASCDEGDFSDTDIHPTTKHKHIEYPSINIKEELASCEEVNDTDMDMESAYTGVYIKEECLSGDVFFRDNDTCTKNGNTDKCHLTYASPSCIPFPSFSSTVEQPSNHTGDKQFSCSECGKFFTTKSNMQAHHRVHTGEKKFSCSECGKYFTAKSSLSAHQRIHTGEKRFCCTVCGKRFTASSCLIAHKRIHTGEKPYACSICGRCFTTNSSLFTHQRTHTGEKPFSCSACGKSFTTNSGLVTHRRSHTGEKPFSCSECGKRFSKTSNLISHKRLHTGEKPFSCLECGKSFISKAYLIIHEKIHMQDKPFSCNICGRCFSQKSSVYRHQRTHANEKSDSLDDESSGQTSEVFTSVLPHILTSVVAYNYDQ